MRTFNDDNVFINYNNEISSFHIYVYTWGFFMFLGMSVFYLIVLRREHFKPLNIV